jgi:hypothetical protein
MGTSVAGRRRNGNVAFALSIVWIITYFGARLVLKGMGQEQAAWGRLAVALVPFVPFAFFLWSFISYLRKADEMEQRINLEALAWAYPLAMILIMLLALLQLAIPLNPDDWSYRHVWPFFWVFWLWGQAFARKRYQ